MRFYGGFRTLHSGLKLKGVYSGFNGKTEEMEVKENKQSREKGGK